MGRLDGKVAIITGGISVIVDGGIHNSPATVVADK